MKNYFGFIFKKSFWRIFSYAVFGIAFIVFFYIISSSRGPSFSEIWKNHKTWAIVLILMASLLVIFKWFIPFTYYFGLWLVGLVLFCAFLFAIYPSKEIKKKPDVAITEIPESDSLENEEIVTEERIIDPESNTIVTHLRDSLDKVKAEALALEETAENKADSIEEIAASQKIIARLQDSICVLHTRVNAANNKIKDLAKRESAISELNDPCQWIAKKSDSRNPKRRIVRKNTSKNRPVQTGLTITASKTPIYINH